MPRRLASGLVALTLLFSLLPMSVAAGPEGRDVTDSIKGRETAQAAAARFTARGFPTNASRLRVIDYGMGELFVVPRGTTVIGRTQVATPDQTNGLGEAVQDAEGRLGTAAVASPPYWMNVGGTCFARLTRLHTWMDTCYHMNKVVNDGSSAYDWYELHVFGTAGPRSGHGLWELGTAYVSSARLSGSPIQSWWDWQPRTDTTGNCRSVTMSVTGGAPTLSVGLSYTHTACETWDITKYAAAGQFRTTYRGPAAGDREAAFSIVSRMTEGQWPRWSLGWDTTDYCSPYFDCDDTY